MTDQTDPVLSIIMPVRNEGGSLSIMLKVLPPLIGTSYEILVVHDDLEDTSVPAAESARADNPKVRVVHNSLGRGVINAVRAGVATARGRYVLIFAADEIGPVFIIRDMLALMEEGCDLVSCTRYDMAAAGSEAASSAARFRQPPASCSGASRAPRSRISRPASNVPL